MSGIQFGSLTESEFVTLVSSHFATLTMEEAAGTGGFNGITEEDLIALGFSPDTA